jgi:outer membrane protein TolC
MFLLTLCGTASALTVPLAGTDVSALGESCMDGKPVQRLDLSIAVAQALDLQPQLLIARANELASKSDLTAARAEFLPQIALSAVEERYVSSHGNLPVVIVDNTILGGAQTNSAYASLGLKLNLWNDGRDVAAYRSAKAGTSGAAYGVDQQLDETLIGVLEAYANLYEAEVTARNDAAAAVGLEAIRARAQRRYAQGYGTEVAVGQARIAALNAEQTFNRSCGSLENKSAAFAQSVGLETVSNRLLRVTARLPEPLNEGSGDATQDPIESSPAVAEARADVSAARSKLDGTFGEYGPTISLEMRRDYLGQDPESFGRANGHIAPADYSIDLELEQPLFPFGSQSSDVEKARAELRKAEASLRQARLDVQTKLAAALSARREAERSYAAARDSLADAEQVLELSEAQYRAGRQDLDTVQHARMDRDAAEANVEEIAAQRALAEWKAARALSSRVFPSMLLRQLHLAVGFPAGRDGQGPGAEGASASP